MGKNHVHHSIKFRLDLNGTLPLLTLVSTSPDKPIYCGPCQLTKQPPPAHWKTLWPCPVLLRSTLSTAFPSHSSWPRPHKVMPDPPMFPSFSSEKQALWCLCEHRAKHKDLQTTLESLFQSIEPAGDAYLQCGRKESSLIVWSHILSWWTKRVY